MSSFLPNLSSSSSKWLTLGVGSLLILGSGYYYYTTKNNSKVSSTAVSSSSSLASSSSSSSASQADFDEALERAKSTNPSKKLSNQTKLRLYGLYKQAMYGSVHHQTPSVPRPSAVEMVAYAKYSAWEECSNLSVEEAQTVYVNLVNEFWKDPNIAASSSSSSSSSAASSTASSSNEKKNRENDKDDENDSHDGEDEGMIRGYSSRPVVPKGPPKEELNQDFHYLCSEGNVTKIQAWIPHRISSVAQASSSLNEIVNQPNEYGETPLHCACDAGHPTIVRYLLTQGSNSNKIEPESGQSPLHYACSQGHTECIEILIKEGKADTTVKDNDGTVPFDLAPEDIQEIIRPWFTSSSFSTKE